MQKVLAARKNVKIYVLRRRALGTALPSIQILR
jgi:hypothetical protein